MLYFFIDKNQIKVLFLKKSLLGQYEVSVFAKVYQSNLLEQGKIINVDFVASAAKEALQSLSTKEVKEKNILLILPQESCLFLRIEVPADIAPSAVESFIKDKARSNLPLNLDEYSYDFFIEEGTTQKYIHFFVIENDILTKYQEALQLIELKLAVVVPETATYFTLFQKTLRKDKRENILYVSYDKNQLVGFLYDSFGQASAEKWIATLSEEKKVEAVLKEKAAKSEQKGIKLNRLILAGAESENVRQDTFTKEIGVWTNPLKRIIPEFYQEYLKLLVSSAKKPFSFLSYEACVGGFIFHEQHKNFSLLKNGQGAKTKSLANLPKLSLPKKEALIFLASFIASFIFFILVSQLKLNLKFGLAKAKPKPSGKIISAKPSPTIVATPTPGFKKAKLKIKVLNGSGTIGKASEVKDLLKKRGYEQILTGNADNFEYEKSDLQIKKSKSASSAMIKIDLKDNITSFKESTLNENEAADIVIIVGKDFK